VKEKRAVGVDKISVKNLKEKALNEICEIYQNMHEIRKISR
jgi:hypothetical protein